MGLDILDKIPRLNSKIKFEDIWEKLSPTQVVMLKYINGLAPAETIFSVLNISILEATEALEDMIDNGWVEINIGDQKKIYASGPELKLEQLDAIPDSGLEETDKIASEFDQIPNELPEESPGKKPVAGQPMIQVSDTATEPVRVVKKTRMPAMPGDMLPRFLIERYFDSESSSYKLVCGKNQTMVTDYFRGQMVKIIPRPLDPNMFLGVMLVRFAGMDKKFINESMKIRNNEDILQGEALIKIGALPPAKIYGMLRRQAEYRLSQLIKSETVGFKKFPARIAKPVEVLFDWRTAVFSSLWNCRSDQWIKEWAENLADCTMERIMVDSTTIYGLGEQMGDLWRTMVVSGKPVSYCGELKILKAELAYRSLYAFIRIGVVSLTDQNGEDPEKDLGVQYFETEVGSTIAPGPGRPPVEESPISISPEHAPPTYQSKMNQEIEDSSFDDVPDDFAIDPDSDSIDDEFGELDDNVIDEGLESLSLDDDEQEHEKEFAKKAEEEQARKTAIIEAENLKEKKIKEEENKKEAAKYFENGMADFAKGNWQNALNSFDEAIKLQPENGEYICFKVFSDFAREKNPDNVKKTLFNLKQTKDMIPESPTPQFLTGMTYKMIGERDKSYIMFQKALELDANHVGALREVRLYNMSKKPEKKSKGLFSR